MAGIRKFKPDPEELRALYQVKSMREIATHYGVGETVVWARIREYGITYENGGNGRKRPRGEFSLEHRLNLSRAHQGQQAHEKSPRWKGGVHARNMRERQTGAYKQWRLAVLRRTNNCCERCGIEFGGYCECCGAAKRAHVHHKESFAHVPEKRFDPENGEALCHRCHHLHHHGKPGELLETPNVETRAISSEAAKGKRFGGTFND